MASLSREKQETWGLYQCQAWFTVPLAARSFSCAYSLTPSPAPAEPGPSTCLPASLLHRLLHPQHTLLTPMNDGCSAQLKPLVKQAAWQRQQGFDGEKKNTSKCSEKGLQRQTLESESLTLSRPWPLLGLCLLLNKVPSLPSFLVPLRGPSCPRCPCPLRVNLQCHLSLVF